MPLSEAHDGGIAGGVLVELDATPGSETWLWSSVSLPASVTSVTCGSTQPTHSTTIAQIPKEAEPS
jgi:hypothetical protein